MDFGVTFQTDPPASRVVELTQRAERARLHARVDVRLAHPLAGALRHLRADARRDRADRRRAVRDQPGDARPDGHRVAVRDAQRHVRQPHDLRHRARRLARGACSARSRRRWPQTEQAIARDQGARRGALDRDAGRRRLDPVGARRQARRVDGGLRAEGAGADRAQGRRLHPPARRPGDPGVDGRARARGGRGGGPRPGLDHDLRRRARRTSATTSPTRASSAAGSAGWSATTSPTSSRRYGEGGEIPTALTDYIRAREGYDYSHHGRAGNPDTVFVPDEIVDRFCVLGTVDDHVAKLRELRGARRRPVQHLPDARRAWTRRSTATASR